MQLVRLWSHCRPRLLAAGEASEFPLQELSSGEWNYSFLGPTAIRWKFSGIWGRQFLSPEGNFSSKALCEIGGDHHCNYNALHFFPCPILLHKYPFLHRCFSGRGTLFPKPPEQNLHLWSVSEKTIRKQNANYGERHGSKIQVSAKEPLNCHHLR